VAGGYCAGVPGEPLQVLVPDLVGVFVFGLSGGLAGVRARLDLFGVTVLAGITALGGGVVRDLLLGLTPHLRVLQVPGQIAAATLVFVVRVIALRRGWQAPVAR
jgi:uncharacterized membrane protein YeiH